MQTQPCIMVLHSRVTRLQSEAAVLSADVSCCEVKKKLFMLYKAAVDNRHCKTKPCILILSCLWRLVNCLTDLFWVTWDSTENCLFQKKMLNCTDKTQDFTWNFLSNLNSILHIFLQHQFYFYTLEEGFAPGFSHHHRRRKKNTFQRFQNGLVLITVSF